MNEKKECITMQLDNNLYWFIVSFVGLILSASSPFRLLPSGETKQTSSSSQPVVNFPMPVVENIPLIDLHTNIRESGRDKQIHQQTDKNIHKQTQCEMCCFLWCTDIYGKANP